MCCCVGFEAIWSLESFTTIIYFALMEAYLLLHLYGRHLALDGALMEMR